MVNIHISTDIKLLVISKEEFENYNDVGKAFIALQTKMSIILKRANFPAVIWACIVQIRNCSNANLSQKLIHQNFYLTKH